MSLIITCLLLLAVQIWTAVKSESFLGRMGPTFLVFIFTAWCYACMWVTPNLSTAALYMELGRISALLMIFCLVGLTIGVIARLIIDYKQVKRY